MKNIDLQTHPRRSNSIFLTISMGSNRTILESKDLTNSSHGKLNWTRLFRICVGMAALVLPISGTGAEALGKAEHVVVMVWDGMRPDFVRPQYTPTLYHLAERGVFFKNHHSVFVSSTEVNGTALITGAYPDHSGIVANSDYRPEIRWQEAGGTEAIESVRRGDLLTGGHYIGVPALTELLQSMGHRTIVAGTKPVALLLDRSNLRQTGAASQSVNLFKGQTLPRSAMESLIKANEDKSFPTNITYPNTNQDAWTTKALTRGLWKGGVPKFSILWLSDPDYSQHDSGPGSATALGALESADKNLGVVIKALEEKGVRDNTDIFVVSDHGFSTIERGIDLPQMLSRAGFKASKKFDDPERGDVLVVGLGGSVALYTIGNDEAVIRRLVDFFQSSDFAGVIFTRRGLEGTFPLSAIRCESTNAPDVLVSLKWRSDRNEFGTPGLIISEGGTKGKGTHASLSPFDMHNTLISAGPDFRSGFLDEIPSGNADLMPTIAWILGVEPTPKCDGRILNEALLTGPQNLDTTEEKKLEASQEAALFKWHQYLKVKQIGPSVYFDEGNGDSTVK